MKRIRLCVCLFVAGQRSEDIRFERTYIKFVEAPISRFQWFSGMGNANVSESRSEGEGEGARGSPPTSGVKKTSKIIFG